MIYAPGLIFVKEKISCISEINEIKKDNQLMYVYTIYCDGNAFQLMFEKKEEAEQSLNDIMHQYNDNN